MKEVKELSNKGVESRNKAGEYRICISAIEKQIPKKPIFNEDKACGDLKLVCTCCGYREIIDTPKQYNNCHKYCSNCGQALDCSDISTEKNKDKHR